MSHRESHEEPSSERPIAELEEEIAILSATIQAATYRLLCLVEELDRRQGWFDPVDPRGFRSCAHWLSWRVGVELSTAREQVRVARALPALPRIAAAFGAGQVSYSKVRAITRVAEPSNERMLLEWALDGTASHVEKLVRRFRRADAVEENEVARERQRTRRLLTYYDRDGMLVVRGRLPPEQGALLLKALEVLSDELNAGDDVSAETSGDAAQLTPGVPRGVSAETSGDAAQVTPGVPRGVSAETSGGAAQVTPGVPRGVSAETPRVTDPAPRTDGDQRWADALVRMAERALAERSRAAPSSDRYQVVVHVDTEVLADPESDGRCALEDGPAIAAETARRLACDGSVCALAHGPDGELVAGRKTRVIQAPLRRALKARDGTRCQFPGCTCRARDAHHMQHWAEGGPTVLENLCGLCRAHHTLVHEGGWRVELLAGGRFRFTGPDGRAVLPAPPLPAVTGDAEATLTARWLPPEVTITPETGRATWDGSPVDYDWARELLWLHTDRLHETDRDRRT